MHESRLRWFMIARKQKVKPKYAAKYCKVKLNMYYMVRVPSGGHILGG